MNNSLELSLDEKDTKKKFWIRVAVDMGWLLLLAIVSIIFIVKNDSTGYWWIVLVFFIIDLPIEFYSSWRKEKYLLTLLKVDAESNSIHIVVNKFDEVHLDKTYPLSFIAVELKELRFGRLFVPNYMLVLLYEGNVILRQRGNLVWKRTEIKKLAAQLMNLTYSKAN